MHPDEKLAFPKLFSQARVILYLAILCLGVSIIWRAIYRGAVTPGWDLVGPAMGQYLLNTGSFFTALETVFYNSRHRIYSCPIGSTLYTIVPGLLNYVHPWELWASCISLLIFAIVILTIAKTAELSGHLYSLYLMAAASSATLCSYSIVGHYNISGALAHTIAFAILLLPRFRKNWLLTLICSLLNIELAMQAYPSAKTMFLMMACFALFDSKAPLKTRVVWLASAATMMFLTFYYSELISDVALSNSSSAALWVENLGVVLKKTFVDFYLDLPFLSILSIFSCFFLPKNSLRIILPFVGMWLVMVVVCNTGVNNLLPRRFLIVDVYGLFIFSLCLKANSDRLILNNRFTRNGWALFIVLSSGVCWQICNLYQFTNVEITQRTWPLPYTHAIADVLINNDSMKWTSKIENLVKRNKKILLIYNYNSYPENSTDPYGVLERLYLRLGHQRFVDAVHIFSNNTERYSRVPLYTVDKFADFLDTLRQPPYKNDWLLLQYNDNGDRNFTLESELLVAKISTALLLKPCNSFDPKWNCYEINPL